MILLLVPRITIGQDIDSIISINDTASYAFLKSELNNKQYLFIGEGSHGDGSSIYMKSNLIDYLTENHGFEVVLLEYDFYKLKMINSLRKFDYSNDILSKILSRDNSMILVDDFKLLKRVENKLDIEGIDIIRDPLFFRFQIKDIENNLTCINKKFKTNKSWKRYKELHQNLIQSHDYIFNSDSLKYEEEFENLSRLVIDQLGEIKSEDNIHLIQSIRNDMELLNFYFSIKFEDGFEIANMEIRDEQMAENIVWFLKQYKDKKVIISTSTYHITSTKNLETPYKTMMDFLPDSILSKAYVLPIIFYEGRIGKIYRTDRKIEQGYSITRPKSSLEYHLHENGYKYAFVSSKSIINKPIYPSHTFDSILDWKKHYNGLLFINSMKPSVLEPLHEDFEEMKSFLEDVYKKDLLKPDCDE